ncbi:MAG: general secretion pathway protein GspB [Candidatus Thiodiazotropha sp. (ex Myrtea spinifera)]|nr:general secretion pathway protein GspB [Candidatus Thiodiazotropha sp. (ex Myrtea spinifera)]MCU7828111.1 general secretion pathway protein GspB [Candidatus Thiodiazotropha sp. (ex Myrtea sp. 'scaly one' KF741663)]
MSLILEALKKAERQHKLGEVPGIRPDPLARQPTSLRGLGWVMLLLFACTMLGLGLYLGGYRLPLTEDEVGQPVKAPTNDQPAVVSTQPQPAKVPEKVDMPVPAQVAPAAVDAVPVKPAVKSPQPKAKPARPLSEMPSGFIANLPELNIDIHSFDQRPAKRYVLINLEKYREGDYLAEGPLLLEVLADGVILEHLGERFILPIGNQ